MRQEFYSSDQRKTRSQREANNKQWYKDQLDSLSTISFSNSGVFDLNRDLVDTSEYKRMRINYDLVNNKINKSDFEHVCSPFGANLGELPADFSNKDIISGKVQALLGMEMSRPFSWRVIAVNEEATTRREEQEFSMIRDYVINSIMTPIRMQIEQKYAEQQNGKELSNEEIQQIQQQIEEELKTMTPPEVKKYMEREHQDPAEALSHQILQYLFEKLNIRVKFDKGFKHGIISGREIFWVGTINGEPDLRVVNPLNFDFDKSSEFDYIEDGEWVAYRMFLTPSKIIEQFGSELTKSDIDEIYAEYSNYGSSFDSNYLDYRLDGPETMLEGIRVLHGEWKSLKLMKFLTYQDLETGEIHEDIVDESYKLNIEAGDISIQEEWIVTKFEGYKIGKDKYVFLREVPGQHRDLSNLYNCKLSYIGACYSNLNSETTSLVDRMKYYQYMYNILLYRVELLLSKDKGKQLLINIGTIPKSAGLKPDQWLHFLESTNIGFVNPAEEGNRGNDQFIAKELDMSLASNIQNYINLAEYIEKRCGESVGITKPIEGQIGASDAVRNTQQAISQSANILESYFDVHNQVKRNVLQQLIEVAKTAYMQFQPKYLSYVLDDMSRKMVSMDYDLLENSTYGIFVSNSMKSNETLQMVKQLSHAALQNSKMEVSDLIKVMRSDSIQEAEELLLTAESQRIEREQIMQKQQFESQEKIEKAIRDWELQKMDKQHEYKMEEINLAGELAIKKQAILSLGFNEDKDTNANGVPDVLELAKLELDTTLKTRKQDLEEKRLNHQIESDKVRERQKDKELNLKANKK